MKNIVVLAAGRGTRLGGACPKPLTPVGPGGESLLERQLRLLSPLTDEGWVAHVVVGHRQDEFRARLSGVRFVEAPRYATTNTSQSLLEAVAGLEGDVLWLNGDVLFSPGFAAAVRTAVRAEQSFVSVTFGRVAEEEVKFRLDGTGSIRELSKTVVGGEGEAIGVNFVSAADRADFEAALRTCRDDDYFEAGIERSIGAGVRWLGLDLTAHFAVEVDFPADLDQAEAYARQEWAALPR
ncbi:NTP transferase domain-containing protein [Kineococcus rhizosphaerae]|uniref:Choline kinase n=1 Tax=Kineococcus rhizosphaerae TaxID=559628 RepID=A0A2T0RAS0_9ACTN|nr:NTP transferase domain-containing protein [Kineococcus rhizosphaerae]PRY18249.1 choline kinase [Kineococcus rhizosphaerae]